MKTKIKSIFLLGILVFGFLILPIIGANSAYAASTIKVEGNVWVVKNNGYRIPFAFAPTSPSLWDTILGATGLKFGSSTMVVVEQNTDKVYNVYGPHADSSYYTDPLPAGTYIVQIAVDQATVDNAIKNALSSGGKFLCFIPGFQIVGCTAWAAGGLGKAIDGVDKFMGFRVATVDADALAKSPAVIKMDVYARPIKTSPLTEALASMVTTMAGFISGGLEMTMNMVNAMLFRTKEIVLSHEMSDTWVEIRNIATSLLVVALIIIAFANVLQFQIENYGLKRMIPKIVIALFFTYFSWLIVTFFFDLSGALQAQAAWLMKGHQSAIESIGSISLANPGAEQTAAAIGMFLVTLAIMIVMLMSLVILLFSLLVRTVMLAFLTVTAPIAMVLGIVPFTAVLYKRWWSEFWKWMFMGPLAVVIIAIGTVLAAPHNTGGTAVTRTLDPNGLTATDTVIKLLFLAGTLYFAATLPKMWGGKIMSTVTSGGKKLWGATGGAAAKVAGAGIKAGAKFAWNESSVGNAWKQGKERLALNTKNRREIKGAEFLEKSPFSRYGKSPDLLRQQQLNSKIGEFKSIHAARQTGINELRDITGGSGPREEKMAAYELLGEKDGLDRSKQGMSDMFRTMNDEQRVMSLLGKDAKKHPSATGLQDLNDARAAVGLGPVDEKTAARFDGKQVMQGATTQEQADMDKGTFQNPDLTQHMHFDAKAVDSLPETKVQALVTGKDDPGTADKIVAAIDQERKALDKAIKDGNKDMARSIMKNVQSAGAGSGFASLPTDQALLFYEKGRVGGAKQAAAAAAPTNTNHPEGADFNGS